MNVKLIDDIIKEQGDRLFLGIDIGKAGGIAMISYKDNEETVSCMKFSKNLYEVDSILKVAKDAFSLDRIHCLVEHVHAFPKQGVVSMFSFGQNLGQWEGMLTSNEISYDYVQPKTWMIDYVELGKPKKERKRLLLGKAKELFPNIKVTFNVSDALLIADYCKNKYYNNIQEGVSTNE
tara:strand:+ start:750 stop:1283 length:534 start_codon:yes stop_codon:yes gene_type:complete